uniref:Uncharacterized protein n=1 Tax=Palpitomonas bilix TaxID=652834 RepID=A0A7S3LVZ3_9EUKA|mmetsp:Transcript_5436/g.12283  ORF Transcript_5436/g.12283 Transcript_5436/m.12283 type:complete len:271 (+) Transcript_5436:390-1202(+)|eukprot:CAMPEP_0113897156 /NCGR_PEP_ID=MMETSP0780_2-20120614/18494_1 /TAXON_ID=652834 /ORGANISM="Palpitomonas bilix" /LENGTH=270 /DNA_ID=CAMNT_0000888531 /DNA_START=224 /DNA_END=1036 /DNA_ORIENTATION=- /assembly_acc=CAM_ASM_000599
MGVKEPTLASALKARKRGLGSDIQTLKEVVAELQAEAKEQLLLEKESQKTFEYLHAQLRSLRKTVTTLSEYMLSDVEGVRAENVALKQELVEHRQKAEERYRRLKSKLEEVREDGDRWRREAHSMAEEVRRLAAATQSLEGRVGKAETKATAAMNAISESMEASAAAETAAMRCTDEIGVMGKKRLQDLDLLREALEEMNGRVGMAEREVLNVKEAGKEREKARREEVERFRRTLTQSIDDIRQRVAKADANAISAVQRVERLTAPSLYV